MADAMLTELYKRVFETKRAVESLTHKEEKDENDDRRRQVEIAKNQLLSELIDIRTEQIKNL